MHGFEVLKDVEAGEEKDSNDEKKGRSSWKLRDPPRTRREREEGGG